MPLSSLESPAAPGPIEVKIGLSPDAEAAIFSSAFHIGRAVECEVRIANEFVSRRHAEVVPQPEGWLVKDLNSSNGLYWNGERVESVLVKASEIVRLGIEGPELWFYVRPVAKRFTPEVQAYVAPQPKPPLSDSKIFTPLPKPIIPELRPRPSNPGIANLPSPSASSQTLRPLPPKPQPPNLEVQPQNAPGQAPSQAEKRQAEPAQVQPRQVQGTAAQNMDDYVRKYFRETNDGEAVGEHTGFIRLAYNQVQAEQKKEHTKQKRVLLIAIAGLAVIGLAVGVYAVRLQREARQQRELARNLFYAMKSLDVEIATAEQAVLTANKSAGMATVNKYEARRRDMQANYDQFLSTLHIYDSKTSEQHRLILRVARIFGECELDMPPGFEGEVNNYIQKWRSTGRYARDIQIAKEKGFTRTIPEALLSRGLPPQFFYLAMQESDFDPWRTGPITYKGYAKGMWQFIPETALKYGLHLGPLVDLNRPDPGDERDNADKATDAASRYIQSLYSTDAQASGLLVMACYNWGETKVLPLVQSMPASPRERNFWKLLAEHRSQIPQETYDYVFYIISAAVIGENPRLFGFDFDNPLESGH
jgi:membrane-bound lytic murein transglycosylase D